MLAKDLKIGEYGLVTNGMSKGMIVLKTTDYIIDIKNVYIRYKVTL